MQDDFIPHLGPTLTRRVPADSIVRINLGDGRTYVDRADAWHWGHGPDGGRGQILGYVELVPPEVTRRMA